MKKLWCRALGEKASNCDKEADKICFIRTLITVNLLITNIILILNVWRHW